MTPSETSLEFWANMKEFIGVPYVYGGPRDSMAAALSGTDCSGAVIASCEDALPGCTGGATYTGDMREKFVQTGLWEWHPAGDTDAVAGDVFLYDREHPGHTGMFDGANIIEEYPPEGRCVSYYEYADGWDGYLHYTGGVPEGDGSYEYYGCGGQYRVTDEAAPYLNVRTLPNLGASTVASYLPGETVNLEALRTVADGYVWGRYEAYSGQTRYVAIAKSDASETYLELV